MTVLLLLLGFVLAVGAGVGVTLWGLSRRRPDSTLSASEEQILASTRSGLETYRPMSRLFAEEDFSFLAAQAGFRPGIEKQLRRKRRQVLRLYLRELRVDFQRVYNLCRMLAPKSQDPSFAALITQQALSFYGLFMVLELRCALGWFLHVRVDTMDLVTAFDRLREAARASLLAMAPQPVLVADFR